MPPVVRLITHIVPARYYLVMLRTIFLKGTGFEAYIFETIFLIMFSVIILTVASKKLVKRVA
jgi:ABC-2 type transport system permease protein